MRRSYVEPARVLRRDVSCGASKELERPRCLSGAGRIPGGARIVEGSVANDGRPLTSAASLPEARDEEAAASRAGASASLGDFAGFFHDHRDDLHRFLWRLTRNAADADD